MTGALRGQRRACDADDPGLTRGSRCIRAGVEREEVAAKLVLPQLAQGSDAEVDLLQPAAEKEGERGGLRVAVGQLVGERRFRRRLEEVLQVLAGVRMVLDVVLQVAGGEVQVAPGIRRQPVEDVVHGGRQDFGETLEGSRLHSSCNHADGDEQFGDLERPVPGTVHRAK